MDSNEFVILLGDEPAPAGDVVVALNDNIPAALTLPAQSCIAQAGNFYQLLAEAMSGDEPLLIDASQVSQFDTTFAQLLLSAARKLSDRGGHLQLQSASETVLSTMARLGMRGHFEGLLGPQRGMGRDAQVL